MINRQKSNQASKSLGRLAGLSLVLISLSSQSFAAGPLTFGEAVDEIVRRDTIIPGLEMSKMAAETSVLSRKMVFLPTLNAGFERNENHEQETLRRQTFVKTGLNVFRGGADVAALDRAKFNLESTKHRLTEEVLEVEFKAIDCLTDYLLEKKKVDIRRRFVKMRNNALITTRMRYQKGLNASQEVIKAEVDLKNAEARHQDAFVTLRKKEAILEALLGHVDVKRIWPFKLGLKKLKKSDWEKWKWRIENNPSFKLAMSQLQREEKQTLLQKLSFLPTIDAEHSWGNQLRSGRSIHDRTSLITLNIPLFDGLRDYSRLKDQKTLELQARHNVDKLRRELEARDKVTWNNLFDQIRSASTRDQTLVLSSKLYKDNYKRYKQGRASINDLLLDQNRFLETETLVAEGWAEVHRSFAYFCRHQGMRMKDCHQQVLQ